MNDLTAKEVVHLMIGALGVGILVGLAISWVMVKRAFRDVLP